MINFGEAPSRDVVTIDLTRHQSNLPLGMLLAPGSGGPSAASASSPTSSTVTLVAGWEHGASGGGGGRHLGPIQRSGLVRLGDRLVRINGRDVTGWSFREVMDALKELVASSNAAPTPAGAAGGRRKRLKTLGFAPAGTAEWSRGTYQTKEVSESSFFGLFHNFQHPSSEEQPARVVHSKTKYSFASFIGGWRVHACGSGPAEMGDGSLKEPQQQRQHSDNSTELERQLNKQPSISYDEDHGHGLDLNVQTSPMRPSQLKEEVEEGDAPTASTSKPEKKPFVEYEIQCHMIVKDQTSFGNPQHVHHSWSVWKRYSELSLLDDELRTNFGWQMDALDDGRGIIFPSPHGIESWWYGVRNGGGVVTSLMGASTGISVEENADKPDDSVGPNHSSLYGWFRASSDSTSASKTNGTAPTDTNVSRNDAGTAQSLHPNCPFPVSFIERRQKELSSYWTNLMRIEDLFEFSDVHSHKFAKAMASFLEVDKVLLSKGGSVAVAAVLGSPQRTHSAFPAIVEEDETGETLGLFRPSFREGFGLTGSHRHDDDVSVLTEATGLAFADSRSPIRDRPVVDVVPGQCASSSDGNGAMEESTPEKQIESASVASSSAAASRRRRKAKTVPRVKPAFQRQFLTP